LRPRVLDRQRGRCRSHAASTVARPGDHVSGDLQAKGPTGHRLRPASRLRPLPPWCPGNPLVVGLLQGKDGRSLGNLSNRLNDERTCLAGPAWKKPWFSRCPGR
jgi:hypothetical protein